MDKACNLSVVIASHNEGKHLERTVRGLLATLPADSELVVVDDLSDDGSAEFDRSDERLRIVRPPVRSGIAAARNLGAATTTGDFLIFSDAHVQVVPGWHEQLLGVLARPEVGAVAPIVSAMGAPHYKGCGFTWSDCVMNVRWLGWQGKAPLEVPMLCGCFLALRREVFEHSHGFDPGLGVWGYEDAELSVRLWTFGYRCVVAPGAEVAHLFRDRFPYEVDSEMTMHNLLRVAILHLQEARLARLVSCLVSSPAFPAAFAKVAASDVWERRAFIRAQRTFDDSWFLTRFGITAFD